MKVKWLVQDVGVSMSLIQETFETLQKMQLPFSNFGVITHTKEITNLENVLTDPDEHFIIRGGTKILSLLDGMKSLKEANIFLTNEQLKHEDIYKQRLKDGIFYDEKSFDQAYYGSLDLPLLNDKASLYPIKDNLDLKFDSNIFIKPSKDQKAFTAGILESGQTIKEFIHAQKYQKTYIEEIAIIAPCKIITAEYRFFVVDKEVITGSMYRFANKGVLSEIIPKNIMDAAKEYAQLYQPHDVFTMDLAETPTGISIVEYNCWNASGLYKTNIAKIFDAVDEYKKKPKSVPKIKM
jgi:ATP-grasp domain, R2K clade family 3